LWLDNYLDLDYEKVLTCIVIILIRLLRISYGERSLGKITTKKKNHKTISRVSGSGVVLVLNRWICSRLLRGILIGRLILGLNWSGVVLGLRIDIRYGDGK